jgi:phospholipid/cholesterol/gamma-HCH transport system ATP-binding protein
VLRRMGVLYQNGALWGGLTLAENVALPLEEFTELDADGHRGGRGAEAGAGGAARLRGVLPGGDQRRDAQACGAGAGHRAGPGGPVLRRAVVRADPISASRLDDLILELRASFGTTIVVVSHDLASIFRIADRALFLDIEQKTMTALGSPAELRDHPPSDEVHRS